MEAGMLDAGTYRLAACRLRQQPQHQIAPLGIHRAGLADMAGKAAVCKKARQRHLLDHAVGPSCRMARPGECGDPSLRHDRVANPQRIEHRLVEAAAMDDALNSLS
ncbi:hypothetical protein G6F65_022479 [Rhizopus arrhizus]|nr:hypothetical protein G6F65_022479 [Rhizopus arrhizus]